LMLRAISFSGRCGICWLISAISCDFISIDFSSDAASVNGL
jgi:hypothetical protein